MRTDGGGRPDAPRNFRAGRCGRGSVMPAQAEARRGKSEPEHDLVVIGASAGGVEALCALMQELPRDFAGAILVVMHLGRTSALPQILTRCGPMTAVMAEPGAVLRHG